MWNAGIQRPSPDPEQVSWTLGYLSAVAAAGTSLRPMTEVYVRGWMEGNCKVNTTETIEAATRKLIATHTIAK